MEKAVEKMLKASFDIPSDNHGSHSEDLSIPVYGITRPQWVNRVLNQWHPATIS